VTELAIRHLAARGAGQRRARRRGVGVDPAQAAGWDRA